MKNIFRKHKRNNSLIKLRKGDIKLNIHKTKEDYNESNRLYNEYVNKRKMELQNIISKKSVEILSSNQLKIYEEFNDASNEEKEKKNLIENKNDNKNNVKEKNNSKKNNILINSTKYNLRKENKNEDLLKDDNNNNNLNKDINNNSDIEDNNNKTNSFFPMNQKTINNNKKDKINNIILKSFKRKKGKYNISNDKEEEDDDEEEQNYNPLLNIKVFYEGKGLSIKISKEEKFSNCIKIIQKMLFPFYKLTDYDILYKLKVLDIKSLAEEKLKNIIDEPNGLVTFYLRKKIKNKIKNTKDTTVLIENFPSFTDLATELNNFFEKEKRESNFTVNYKGNVCKVSFSESEKAFSLIIYLTKLKKVNPIYKRLKVNMDYKLNVILDIKKLRQKPIKLILPLINKNSSDTVKVNKSIPNRKKLEIKTENTLSNDNYSNNNKSRNNNLNNINTVQINPQKRFESCVSIRQNIIFNSESQLFKNKLKNPDYSGENNIKQARNNIRNLKLDNYNLISQKNTEKIIYNSSLSDDSDKIMNKLSKIKSTNFLINLNKNKKKKGLKNLIFKNKSNADDNDDKIISS